MGLNPLLTVASLSLHLRDTIFYRFPLKAVFGKFSASPRFRKRDNSPVDTYSHKPLFNPGKSSQSMNRILTDFSSKPFSVKFLTILAQVGFR